MSSNQINWTCNNPFPEPMMNQFVRTNIRQHIYIKIAASNLLAHCTFLHIATHRCRSHLHLCALFTLCCVAQPYDGHNEVNSPSKNWEHYLQVRHTSYFWTLRSFHMFTVSLVLIKLYLLNNVSHSDHSKCNCLHDRANFHRSWAW